MLLQLARSLIKISNSISNGNKGDGIKNPLNAYLFDLNQPKKSQLNEKQGREQQWAEIQKDFEHVARSMVFDAAKKLQK